MVIARYGLLVLLLLQVSLSLANPTARVGDAAYIQFEFLNATQQPVKVVGTRYFADGAKSESFCVTVNPQELYNNRAKSERTISRVVLDLPKGYHFKIPSENKMLKSFDSRACAAAQGVICADTTC